MLLLVASALIELSRCLEALQPSLDSVEGGAAWSLCLCPSLFNASDCSLAPASAAAMASERLLRAELWRGYPLNLSILVRGGEGTNEDSLSNGE